MKFKVTVRKGDGPDQTQVIDAPTRFAVYSQIEADGGTVMALQEMKGGTPAWMNITIGSAMNTEQKITFTKNLASMINAGLTLSRALSVIERQTKKKIAKDIIIDLETKIKAGTSFHEALGDHKKEFSRLFIAMSKAGEEGGTLSSSLAIVAKQMDRSATLTKKVKGAMIYPAIILFAIVVIGILMLMFVVPTLAATFESFGSKLPLSTQIIIDMSNFVSHNGILVFVALIAIIIAGSAFFRTKQGSALVLFVSLHMPVIGELVRETFSARAARTLSSLLSSGVEMLTALTITQEVVGENTFGRVVGEAEERVRKGEPLSVAFVDHPKLYPILVGDMISVGEETGKVSEMLAQLAEYYEVDVEDRTKDLSTIIEPLLMLFIGAFVGVFAVSMIAPIYSLSSTIS